jgi:CMP-N-acetylneuraminic acid synthetase
MREPEIRAFIFARGGSKGVPGKNIKPLGGKPLIGHAIECALACPSLGSVTVSTDDPEIAAVAREFGADVPFLRPAELAGDSSAEWLAWRHAIAWFEDQGRPFDVMVSLPTTSPFRAVEDVENCLAVLRDNPSTDAVITVTEADRSPYFNMVRFTDAGQVRLAAETEGAIARRQDAPKLFNITTVAYAVRTAFVMRAAGLFEGAVQAVEVPQERALDIDTPHDFKIAQLLAADRASHGSVSG